MNTRIASKILSAHLNPLVKHSQHNTHRTLPAWQYGRMHVAHDRAHKRALVRERTWAAAMNERLRAFVASTPGAGA